MVNAIHHYDLLFFFFFEEKLIYSVRFQKLDIQEVGLTHFNFLFLKYFQSQLYNIMLVLGIQPSD